MRSLQRIVLVGVGTIVAALPAILAEPSVRTIIADHPWLAAYLPAAAGVIVALYRAYRPSPETRQLDNLERQERVPIQRGAPPS